MKKLIVIAAAALAASPAMASKSRITALGESRQLNDIQYVFERPHLLNSMNEQITFEWGDKADAASPHAEGGFFKKAGDGMYGIYLGRKSADFDAAVAGFNGVSALTDALEEQNPINLLYAGKMGDLSYGVSFKYSNGKDNDGANDLKVSTMGVALGVTNGTWEAELVQGLSGKSETGAESVESKGNSKLTIGYNLSDSMHVYGSYKATKTEIDSTVDVTIERTDMALGYINTIAKADGVNAFYGVAYTSAKQKDGDETTALPVWIGVEAEASSWMVFRGSVKQNVVINETKQDDGDKLDKDSIVVAAGAGFKLGKGMLDATFSEVTTGQLDSASLFTNVSYTYSF